MQCCASCEEVRKFLAPGVNLTPAVPGKGTIGLLQAFDICNKHAHLHLLILGAGLLALHGLHDTLQGTLVILADGGELTLYNLLSVNAPQGPAECEDLDCAEGVQQMWVMTLRTTKASTGVLARQHPTCYCLYVHHVLLAEEVHGSQAPVNPRHPKMLGGIELEGVLSLHTQGTPHMPSPSSVTQMRDFDKVVPM